MTGLTYVTHELVFLKSHPEFTEKWLQDRIADDPTIGVRVAMERKPGVFASSRGNYSS